MAKLRKTVAYVKPSVRKDKHGFRTIPVKSHTAKINRKPRKQ
jgi:hypothetical protein